MKALTTVTVLSFLGCLAWLGLIACTGNSSDAREALVTEQHHRILGTIIVDGGVSTTKLNPGGDLTWAGPAWSGEYASDASTQNDGGFFWVKGNNKIARGIYNGNGAACNVTLVMADGVTELTFANFPVGFSEIAFSRILNSGTACGKLVALY